MTYLVDHAACRWEQRGRCVVCADHGVRLYQGELPDRSERAKTIKALDEVFASARRRGEFEAFIARQWGQVGQLFGQQLAPIRAAKGVSGGSNTTISPAQRLVRG